MVLKTGMSRPEVLQMASALAAEKGVDREEMLQALELAIRKVARSKYGQEKNIEAHINRSTGEVSLVQKARVVEEVEDPMEEIDLTEAQSRQPDIKVGDIFEEVLPPLDYGRVSAQIAKQTMSQQISEIERKKTYETYKDRLGELVVGVVKRADRFAYAVDLGRAEVALPMDQLIGRERFQIGDRIRAVIAAIRPEARHHVVMLSRTDNRFIQELFEQEVPEIAQGAIHIKAIARDPGSRAKVAVYSVDSSIDPIGACVGMRGVRINAVVNELKGERIDLVQWSEDPVELMISALRPIPVSRVLLDEPSHTIEVVVPDDSQAMVIGRRGQNIRLISQLVDWNITVSTETSNIEKREQDMTLYMKPLMEALDADEMIARLLILEGITSPEHLTSMDVAMLSKIEGFDEAVSQEVLNRAKIWTEKQMEKLAEKAKVFGASENFIQYDRIPLAWKEPLLEKGIKTLDDFADLAAGELQEMLNGTLSEEEAKTAIMDARYACGWFAAEESSEEEPPAADPSEDSPKDDTESV